MKDIIQKLNSIDVMDLFKKKSPQHNQSPSETISINASDKVLYIMLGLGATLFILGAYASISTWNGYRQLSQLKIETDQLDRSKAEKQLQIDLIKKKNSDLLQKITTSPLTQSDFMKTLSDVFAKSGLSITKIVTGTATDSNLIQIESEGDFAAVQAGLQSIREISPSTELKSIGVSYNRDTGFLKVSTVMKFVAPPKILGLEPSLTKLANSSLSNKNFMDSPKQTLLPYLHKVQFVPKQPSGNTNTTSTPSNSKDTSKPVDNTSVNRNPFYMPPPTNQTQNNFVNGMDGNLPSGNQNTNTGAARPAGLYLNGCMLMPSDSACLFQMPDGGTSVFSKGQQIQSGMKLLRINQNFIVVSSPNGEMTYKIGEQIK